MSAHVLLSPRLFFKSEGDIVIASVRPSVCPSVRSLCYLLLNHWTKFNEIWCVSFNNSNFWRDQKVKYNLISITKSISKSSIPNFVCILTNERYKTF